MFKSQPIWGDIKFGGTIWSDIKGVFSSHFYFNTCRFSLCFVAIVLICSNKGYFLFVNLSFTLRLPHE